ncbi:hypothetical protein DFP72DRAFT_1074303 [Ephemerocybe angulata]|uniref:Uncharacterized protein n=1 Tax=Ephemerocybe angulata TaxID=980116 RepID=A0A8H6HJX0_9AGAR|nr:hypothetical protein DFP72DRAFT_1074303 [Tulosesus angulatus]
MPPTPAPKAHRLCQCIECKLNPGPHPVTGLPSTGDSLGRWLPISEHIEHAKLERNRAVATSRLTQMGSHVPNTLPAFPGQALRYDPPPQAYAGYVEPSYSSTSTSTSPNTSRPQSPHSSESEGRRSNPRTPNQSLIDEFRQMRNQLKVPSTVVGHRVMYFKTSPDINKPISTSKLDILGVDSLCALDPTAQSNSQVIGYQQLLNRTEKHARSHTNDESPTIRVQAKQTLKVVEEYQAQLRSLLLNEWRRQRMSMGETNFYNTGKWSSL